MTLEIIYALALRTCALIQDLNTLSPEQLDEVESMVIDLLDLQN